MLCVSSIARLEVHRYFPQMWRWLHVHVHSTFKFLWYLCSNIYSLYSLVYSELLIPLLWSLVYLYSTNTSFLYYIITVLLKNYMVGWGFSSREECLPSMCKALVPSISLQKISHVKPYKLILNTVLSNLNLLHFHIHFRKRFSNFPYLVYLDIISLIYL
jgi:hypothetical protein